MIEKKTANDPAEPLKLYNSLEINKKSTISTNQNKIVVTKSNLNSLLDDSIIHLMMIRILFKIMTMMIME